MNASAPAAGADVGSVFREPADGEARPTVPSTCVACSRLADLTPGGDSRCKRNARRREIPPTEPRPGTPLRFP